jgi:hypothetical protein
MSRVIVQAGARLSSALGDTQEQASFTNSPDFLARLEALGVQRQGAQIYEVTDQI